MALHTDRTKVDESIKEPAYVIENADEKFVKGCDTHAEAVEWVNSRLHPGGYMIKEVMAWPMYLQTIEMMMMAIDMGKITEDNYVEFYSRVAIWEQTFGANIKMVDADNNLVDQPITLEQVHSCIGLSANVFPMATRAKFIAKVKRILATEAAHKLRRTEQSVDRALTLRGLDEALAKTGARS